ncbi:polyprenyl diphosphate synthase [Lentisphaerota bacterium WC36G]|nr:di-trans,poly-cis-decaprenylcistransferase [Lentisphaerae bacterium WC36]
MVKNKLDHLAIIMDGNGRWAKQRGLKRTEGHKAGAENVKEIIQLMEKYQIKYLSLYAFSSENWRRSPAEINALMRLLKEFLDGYEVELMKNDIKLLAIGRFEKIPPFARQRLLEVIKSTKNNSKGVLTLCFSYGGREEIVDAAKKVAADVMAGNLNIDSLDESNFTNYLYAPEVPEVDLMIRTSGELRISNFLLWQLAYSEFYVTDKLWPDFDELELNKALNSFYGRERRFGKEQA